jgi:uncharacterized repeat protein (TIGR03833 family)
MDGTVRAAIKPGIRVSVVMKKDQRTGALTEGTVKDILTNSPKHPHGIKVRLENGKVGRVKHVLSGEIHHESGNQR